MTPERHQQIASLLRAVQARKPDERIAYLDEVCQSDAGLRQGIIALLQEQEAKEKSDGWINPKPMDSAPSLLISGQHVGRYRIERQLGAGGMGVVYLAYDANLKRLVSLKLLPARFTQDPDRMRRFQQEARTASALNHPNLLTIYEVGQTALDNENTYYIVAEFVEGKTLRELARTTTLNLGKVLDIIIQLTDALTAAHQASIIHRDIKPENIMVRPDGIVKVLDFGLAKLSMRDEGGGIKDESEKGTLIHPSALIPHTFTMPGTIIGTVAYMSPEQARGLPVDARSDLFSVGIVLYELLTGRKPFHGETPSDVIAALLEREPLPLSHFVTGLPATLEQIVRLALMKAPAARYQTAQELGDAVRKLKQELEFTAHLNRSGDESPLLLKVGAAALGDEVTRLLVASKDKPDTNPDVRSRGRRRMLSAVAIALLVALLGWWWMRREPSNATLDSIAVLPFLNSGNDPQMEYLPDALTENLIDSLTRLPALRVRARTTVASYKGREVDPRQVGKDLKVAGVVIGRIQQQGERLILRVELVDTADGSRLWGDEFQYTRANLATMQSDIAREIAAKLHRRLTPADQQQLAKRHSTNSQAYELYSQGRYLYLQYNRASQEKALEYFQQAIAIDPHYALAYCGIADVYADFSSQYLSPREAIPKAREAALKAIEYDESLPEAHHSLALVKLWGDWDWAGAEREYKRALDLNPNFMLTRLYYNELLVFQKRFEEATRVLRPAQEYDPVSIRAKDREASVFFYSRQFDRALPLYQKILEFDPKNLGTHRRISVVYDAQKRHQEALAEMIKGSTPSATPSQRAWLAYMYARAGQRNEALKILRELEAMAQRERISPSHFSRIYLGLGDYEKTFFWLRKMYEEQSDHLLNIGVDPIFDPLRTDPRFTELLRGIGLAP